MELTDQDFTNLKNYIQNIIGLSIQQDKKYLISQRLEPIVKSNGFKSFTQFYLKLQQTKDRGLNDQIIAAITTNETSFFRDSHPFDTFRDKIIPQMCYWIKERKSRLYMRRGPKANIWCAASSTGQEPYTLAMLLMDAVRDTKVPGVLPEDFVIIASDVSNEVLAKAMSGIYEPLEISRGLPDYYKTQYFTQKDDKWMVKENIQKLVEFRRVNLVEPFRYLGGFDIIFCRNVLIYFDVKTRLAILEQFYHMLNPEGFLFLGASENIFGVTDKFESQHLGRTIIYKRKPPKEPQTK